MYTAYSNALHAPLEPILHASPMRLKVLGVFTLCGQLLFGWLWLAVFPQPYENIQLRTVVASLSLFLVWNHFAERPDAIETEWMFACVMWAQLPFLFMLLYFLNGASTAWFGSVVAMVVVYYQLTDWRLATLGILVAICVSFGVDVLLFTPGQVSISVTSAQGAVIFFAWASALVLSISAANLRRIRMENSLTTMGIIAHELRTPLATLSLLGDALRNEAAPHNGSVENAHLAGIAARMYALSRSMNEQIDMQIANAGMLRSAPSSELLSASALVRSAVLRYPFKHPAEKNSFEVAMLADFQFAGTGQLVEQVILNLLKNAFMAVALNQKPPSSPAVRLEVTCTEKMGCIKVYDRGIGMDTKIAAKIFEPFFSTHASAGHGLGLAFCKTVVSAAGGKILVASELGVGTCFTVLLPLASPGSYNISQRISAIISKIS
jgi:two-component system, CAI-1 autoinducer sensor kinase/phosphatase CqsS